MTVKEVLVTRSLDLVGNNNLILTCGALESFPVCINDCGLITSVSHWTGNFVP